MIILLLSLLQQASIPDVEPEIAFPKLKFNRCVVIAWPPDGTNRLFIVEQKGRVFWIENRPDATEKHLALDVEFRVLSRHNEEGLLGLAFHPKFKTNRQVILQYSEPKEKKPKKRWNVLSRFTMNADRTKILPESEEVLLKIPQPFGNHNGGCIQFGPDGYLYLGLGDGGFKNDPHLNGQKMTTMLGKFIRIDVDAEFPGKKYAIPPDNPFIDANGVLPEIWSTGWRNPWGFHFDRKTGVLWSGDVGQDKWEEVNVVVKGGNYGWSVRESFHPFKGKATTTYVDPLAEHDHGMAKSITGGVVYRGPLKELDGVYLYGDFVTGNTWGLRWDGKKVVAHKLLFELTNKQIAIFGEDRAGEVYFSSFDKNLYRFKLKGR